MSETNKKPSIKKNFALNSLYQILTIITPFITAPYLARVLGVTNIGINSYIHSILYFFTIIGKLGTDIYGAREIARTRDNKKINSQTFWEIELLTGITTFVVLIGWIILSLLSGENKIYYLILILNILSVFLNINWFYIGHEQFKFIVTRNFIVKIMGIILIMTTVKKPEHLGRMILINSGTEILANITMWIPLKNFLSKIDVKSLEIWKHFKESFVYFIPAIATSIYTILDKTLIGLITHNNDENGFYEQANKIITIAKTFSYSSITGVMGTRMSYLFGQNAIEEVKSKMKKSIDLIMFMSFGCCFGLIGIADTFIPLFYGPGYEKSIIILKIISPTLIIMGTTTCLGNLYFIPAGLRKKSCYFEIIGAGFNLILNLLLIPKLASIGAVIGSVIAEILIMILYLYYGKEFLSVAILIQAFWKKLIAAVVMTVYLLVFNKITIEPLIKLVSMISSGAFVYIVLLIALKDSSVLYILNTIVNKFKQVIKFKNKKHQ